MDVVTDSPVAYTESVLGKVNNGETADGTGHS